MDDAEFEAVLAQAFQTPVERAVGRDLTAQILARVRNDGRARAGVLAGAGLVGAGIAASAVVATRLVEPLIAWAGRMVTDLRLDAGAADATPFVALGLLLTLAVVVRNGIRDL